MDPLPSHPVVDLGWSQVGFGLTFIAFNSIISQALQLGIGASLVFAALRCVVQLTLVATILQRVFAAENFWAVVGIACKYIVVRLAGVVFTVKFDSPSIAELTWHDRNRCVRFSSLSTSLRLIYVCLLQNKS
jgi:ABC-type iron transport system FetAB permease component